MKKYNKPLLIIGIILAVAGFLLWMIFQIVNITVILNHNLNLAYPAGVGILGLISIILSVLLQEFRCHKDKNDTDDNKDE